MPTATVTVLFSDLVGSTELLSRVGEVAADELRREHFALLREAVAASGGTEVKNLGDGLMVVFDGVGRALGCAVAMQQAMAARPVGREPLAIRVGVAVGEAELEDGDYFGLPVVEAARLCALAEGGEVLVTGMVRMLARSRGGFDLELVGDLDLKGLDEPVETWRVGWVPLESAVADEDGVPVPPRVASLAAGGGFVGRDDVLGVLSAGFKAATGGERRAVLLAGEPGVGKTTVASRFALDAAGSGAWVLYGRCDEDLFVPYQPWVEALGWLVEHAPAEVIAGHVAACGGVLGRVVPQLARRAGGIDVAGEEEPDLHLLISAVVDVLARASQGAPLVVLLDDLHWADASTLQLLRQVLAANAAMRVVVVGTYRDSDVDANAALGEVLAVLRREPGVDRVTLRGLGDLELLALLELVAGHQVGDDAVALRDWLAVETAGNPFFVGEVLRHLAETGVLRFDRESGRWGAGEVAELAGVPTSVSEVVAHRVARLGAETERVLTMASVIGRDFDVDLLARVVELDADHVADLCDVAVSAAVLAETGVGGYTFAHALVARSLYTRQSTNRRARAHRAVAEALEELASGHGDARVGELAHHWANATRPQDLAKAVDYARRAGNRAAAAVAPAEAIRWYRLALELIDQEDTDGGPTVERTAVLVGLGKAQRLADDPDYRDTLLRAATDAHALGAADLLVSAVANLSRVGGPTRLGGVDESILALVRAAVDVVDPADSPERARLLAVLVAESVFADPGGARFAAAEEAIAIARRLGDPKLFVEVVARCEHGRASPATFADRRDDAREALTIATSLGNLKLLPTAHFCAAHVALESGDRDAYDHHVAEYRAAVSGREGNFVTFTPKSLEILGIQLDGDPDAIDRHGAELFELATRDVGERDALVLWSGSLISSAWMRGRLGDLIPVVRQTYLDNPQLEIYAAVLAWAEANTDPEAAAVQISAARERSFPIPLDYMHLLTVTAWAEAVAIVGDRAAAALLLPMATPWAHLVSTSRASFSACGAFSVARLQATLGDLDAAVTSFEQAWAIHQRLRAPFFVAFTEAALADTLQRRGTPSDAERAHALATSALATATQRGYRYVERDATAVLDRLGDSPRG